MKPGTNVESASSPEMTRPQRGTSDWRVIYARRLVVTDAVVICCSIFGTQLAWFGASLQGVDIDDDAFNFPIDYTVISCILVLAWLFVLTVYGTRDYRILGTGTAEYKQVADATLRLFGIIAIVAFLAKIDLARGYIITGLPLGLLLLLLSRALWRSWLSAQRKKGEFSSLILLVGSLESATRTAMTLRRQPSAGYRVVGACLTGSNQPKTLTGTEIPVMGSVDDVLDALTEAGADTVVLTSSDELPPERIRELSWSLEPGRRHLVMAPGLTDVGGPRIHTRPVAGLPLIHVETPRHEGRKQLTKRLFDLIVAGFALVILSPVFLVLAIVVKSSSRGDIFYSQERIGLNGKPFHMLKLRSMKENADLELLDLLEQQGTGDRPLFKVKDDPRITRVGGVLRRYSLDELPQFVNVFLGSMSLVGPRPQREGEVALYDSAARRRLLIKPGMSGLWQVSGRSSLSWEDAIRLDLYYVENWSLTNDIAILGRTFKAVFQADGAV